MAFVLARRRATRVALEARPTVVFGRSTATAVYWREGASTESYSYLVLSSPTQ